MLQPTPHSRLALIFASITLLAACSQVADDERLIYVPPVDITTAVLIEDFTGQMCVNCPLATDEILRLQEQYGEDNVIAVGIHSGPFGVNARGVNLPLTTDVGRAYFDHWNLDEQPVALINRDTITSNYDTWGSYVRRALQRMPVATLTASPLRITADSICIDTIEAKALTADLSARLTAWIVEDSIVQTQYMPRDSINREYMHRHVFRSTISDPYGDAVQLREQEPARFSYRIALDPAWNPHHLSAVVFITGDSGVLQVVQTHAAPTAIQPQP